MAPTTDNSNSTGAAIEAHYPVSTVEMTAFTAVCGSRERPLWVRVGHSAMSPQCPLYPPKRKSIRALAMSQKCQFLTHAPQQTTHAVARLELFNHLVGAAEQRQRET
jgi:hypothetical protein